MNKLNKIGMYALGVLGAVGSYLGFASTTHAVADVDLVAGLASSTALFTDNKAVIIGYAVGIIVATTLIALVIKAMFFGKRSLLGVFGGGRKKR